MRESRRLLSRRRDYDRFVRNRRRDEALGERGRRVLEDAGAEERRRHPDGSERRNFLKNNCRLRRDQDGRRIRLLVFAGGDQRDCTLVIRRTGVGMKPRVQLRRSGEREREEKSRKQAARDQRGVFRGGSCESRML